MEVQTRRKIKDIIMERDGLSEEEAQDLINRAKANLMELIEEGRIMESYEICYDWFGLEPDYLDELMI